MPRVDDAPAPAPRPSPLFVRKAPPARPAAPTPEPWRQARVRTLLFKHDHVTGRDAPNPQVVEARVKGPLAVWQDGVSNNRRGLWVVDCVPCGLALAVVKDEADALKVAEAALARPAVRAALAHRDKAAVLAALPGWAAAWAKACTAAGAYQDPKTFGG